MGTKNLKILSTRHTAIGSFRKGVIYHLDDKDYRVVKVIKNLTDKGSKENPKTPAAILLSDDDVKKARSEVETLVPKAEAFNTMEQLAQARAAIEELTDGLTKAKAAIDEKSDSLDHASVQITELQSANVAEKKRADEAEARVATAEADLQDAEKKLEATQAEIAELKAEVAKAKKAAKS